MADADTNAPQDELARAEAALAELERKTREARARVQALRARKTAVRESPPPYVTPPSPPTAQDQPDAGPDPALPPTLPRSGGRLRPALDQSEEADQGLRARVRQRVDPRRLREAADQVWRVSEPGLPPGGRQGHPGHLQGQHVLGVYPLLRDETCWFLAVDFDGTGWRDDVAAFVETCAAGGVRPPSSGPGPAMGPMPGSSSPHRWPRVSRGSFGSFLLTETMARRHQLSMRVLRPPLPQPGYPAPRRVREPDRPPAPARGRAGRQHALRRHDLDALPRPVGHAGLGRRAWIPPTWSPWSRTPPDADQIVGVRSAGLDDEAERRRPVDPSAVRDAQGPSDPWAAPSGGPGRPGPAPLRREGRPPLPAAQPDQAPGRVPEPGVLQEAADAIVHGPDSPRDRLRRGAPRAPRPAPRVSPRSRGPAPAAWRAPDHRRSAHGR